MQPNLGTIKFNKVNKIYFQRKQKTLKEFLPAFILNKPTKKKFNALKDIDWQVKRGESWGVIGPNGSGKSTLLKIIAGVSQPNSGTHIINGRVAPLIELSAGFHPELSGRENLFLNGIILGLTHKELEKKFDQIVEFAGIKKFIDEPLKHYSSGMFLRLAFSVAIHTRPDILLIDEILAVGDHDFQQKCLQKVRQLQKQKVTIILVSHDEVQIKNFCKKSIYLKDGKIKAIGNTNKVIKDYQNDYQK